jgi:hypothetical protein
MYLLAIKPPWATNTSSRVVSSSPGIEPGLNHSTKAYLDKELRIYS